MCSGRTWPAVRASDKDARELENTYGIPPEAQSQVRERTAAMMAIGIQEDGSGTTIATLAVDTDVRFACTLTEQEKAPMPNEIKTLDRPWTLPRTGLRELSPGVFVSLLTADEILKQWCEKEHKTFEQFQTPNEK
jgi:hypothetical protein